MIVIRLKDDGKKNRCTMGILSKIFGANAHGINYVLYEGEGVQCEEKVTFTLPGEESHPLLAQ